MDLPTWLCLFFQAWHPASKMKQICAEWVIEWIKEWALSPTGSKSGTCLITLDHCNHRHYSGLRFSPFCTSLDLYKGRIARWLMQIPRSVHFQQISYLPLDNCEIISSFLIFVAHFSHWNSSTYHMRFLWGLKENTHLTQQVMAPGTPCPYFKYCYSYGISHSFSVSTTFDSLG